ncbi:MAG: hypothetical protein JWN91_4376 [Nocardioides sp.]|nr:hypothetical protein [Nocardioides sp.]
MTTTGDNPGIEEIETDIARTREELAATVDELSARLDVKTRVKESVQQTKDQAVDRIRTVRDQATDEDGRPTPTTLGIGGAVAATVVVVLALTLWRRRR